MKGLFTYMNMSANISPCGTYRYWLRREWESTKPACRWIMLNPSTADHEVNDPTIRRCIDFARRWGCGSIDVYNLFAFRAAKVKDMMAAGDPVGPNNDETLREISGTAGIVVVAWGRWGSFKDRAWDVLRLLRECGAGPLLCLGTTTGGEPRHPLFVPAATTAVPYHPE